MAYQSVDLKNSVNDFETPASTVFGDRRSKYKKVGIIFAVCCFAAVVWSASTSPVETFNLARRQSAGKVITVEDTSICKEPTYSQTTLKTAEEGAMVALFYDVQGNTKFEASDVVVVKDAYYVVYDNLYAIGRISKDLPFRSHRNVLVGNRSGESAYEAIVHDEATNRFFVVVEAVKHSDEKFHAVVEEIEMIDRTEDKTMLTRAEVSFKPIENCPCEMSFARENKGFEGATLIRTGGNEDHMYLLGLCEGNFCEGGRKGREAGNGRIVVMRKVPAKKDRGCYWETVRILELPRSINFVDYSAITILAVPGKPHEFKFAVSSQESAAVWIGHLYVSKDTSARDWRFSEGKIYDFPRDDDCRVIYCNVEGLSFISETMLVAVSDQMKVDNRQPFRCLAKDQSIHVFVIPRPEQSSQYYKELSKLEK